jgi:myo-inositol-hexaphosphate 3-phosphohydrolase
MHRTARTRRAVGVLVAALVIVLGLARPATAAPVPVAPTDETTPVANGGDAADDPAIWVHPTNPAASLVIGNDKLGALETYNLDGTRRQRITTGTTFWGNVDVRGNLVVAWNGGGARVYRIDPGTRMLTLATDGNGVIGTVGGEGLCLYRSPSTLYVFAITRGGVLRQYALGDADADGRYEGRLVRQFAVGSEAEGCVADDANGALSVSEEDVALWRYGAAPGAGSARTAVDRVTSQGGRIAADAEGVAVVGSYLILSAQNVASPGSSFFLVYDRTSNAYLKEFRVVNGTRADDCDRTDGIEAYAGNLGPLFPNGLFVCQDGPNNAPGSAGNQNFKFVPFNRIVAA